jgi:hypothetical protein
VLHTVREHLSEEYDPEDIEDHMVDALVPTYAVPCPLCRAEFTVRQIQPDPRMSYQMRDVRVPCSMSAAGCAASLNLLQVEHHVAVCEYATGRCTLTPIVELAVAV